MKTFWQVFFGLLKEVEIFFAYSKQYEDLWCKEFAWCQRSAMNVL